MGFGGLAQVNRNAVVEVQAHIDEEGSLGVAYLWGTVMEDKKKSFVFEILA